MQEHHLFCVGIPNETCWSVGNVFSHEETQLFVTLTVQNTTDDSASVGKRCLEELQTWFESTQTIDQALAFLSQYQFPTACSAVVVFVQGERVVSCAIGDATLTLRRAGAYLPLISPNEQFQCIQGTIYQGDAFVFGTRVFAKRLVELFPESSDPLLVAQKLSTDSTLQQQADFCGCVTIFGKLPELTSAPKIPTQEIPPPILPPPVPEKDSPTPVRLHRSVVRFQSFPISSRLLKIALFCICVIGLIAGIHNIVIQGRQKRIAGAVSPLEARFQAVKSDSQSTRVVKEQNIADLMSDIEGAKETFAADPATLGKLTQLHSAVATEYEHISKEQKFDHLPVFYDFRLVTSDFIASQIAFDEPGKLGVFLDPVRRRLVSLSLEKKQPQTVSIGEDAGALQAVTVVDRRAYVLGNSGIYEVSLPLDTAGKLVASSSAGWQDPKLIGEYGENLYVFDRGARQVFRYDRSDMGASPSAWLRGKEGVDIEQITSLTIDGDVWMGSSQGKVYKFTRGDRTPFSFQDVRKAPESTVSLFTSEKSSLLYVLEPRAQRILVFDKSGQYQRVIVSPDLEAASKLIVDESAKKAYVLAGSLVYEVGL